jgi:hypothetical protein
VPLPSLMPDRHFCTAVQLKLVLNAIYFGADHVVWAGQAGVYLNKESLDKCAPALSNIIVSAGSLTCYMYGSVI